MSHPSTSAVIPYHVQNLKKARKQLELAKEAFNLVNDHREKAFEILRQLNKMVQQNFCMTTPLESKCILFINKSINDSMEEIARFAKLYTSEYSLLCNTQDYIDEFLEYGNIEDCDS